MLPDQLAAFIAGLNCMVNEPDFSMTDQLFAPHFTAHVPIMPPLNRTGFKSFLQSFHATFPDFHQEIHDTIYCGDRLTMRLTYHGTHQGSFLGIAATGSVVIMPAMCIFRIENDWVVECWMEMDIFGVINQISRAMSIPVETHVQNLN